jgi:hypothetical protein
MILKKPSSIKILFQNHCKTFKTLSADLYFENYSKSTKRIDMQQSKLHPLIEASSIINKIRS